ncbi:zinc finger protein 142 [Erythrolamprus reginae]|uniref:zinc finger protein 142 n=1 Tax=Erythrolamprus reginae TaxID=121349 RepID=UPI00396C3626
MSRGTVATESIGGDKMSGLCQELLLPDSGIAGNEDSHGISSENLPVGQSLLLTEASVVGTETGGVEIFVEAMSSTMALSNPGNPTEVLVKVVELYFCEQCGRSFPDPSLLSQHQCGEQSTVGQVEGQDFLDESRQDPQFCSEPLPCPICQMEFALPTELKEHFKEHHKPQGAQACPEEGCQYNSGDRKELRGHLRHVHQVSPIVCTFRGCPVLFRNHEDMKLHRRSHFPFHCDHCEFISANIKQFGLHRQIHLHEAMQQEAIAMVAENAEGKFPSVMKMGLTDNLLLNTENLTEESKYLFKTHMCPECKRCFKKRTHLVEHLHLHFPDPRLQCPNCQKFFTSKSKLKIHMMRETGEKAHCCPLCHYSSVEKNALNRHMASMHEGISNFYSDVYSCPVCKEKFKLSQALKDHLKSHKAEPKQLSCFQAGCSYGTEDRKEFLRHVKEVHGLKAVECKYYACSLLFPSAEIMEAHRKTHYAFHCQQCDFICSNKHVFRKHKKQGHPGSEELQCSFCPFATFNSVEFHDHVGKMHASEKIHKCTECGFATAHKRVLIRHMLLHTGEKPHKCQLCDFTCRDVSYLSKHMLIHSDDKNYMCTECGYVTKWKHYLNVHMRKHTGDLRYQCNQCSYRCHRADQLSSHKLRHQGKSLICEICGFACKRKYELQKHMKSKHSQDYQMPIFQCQYCSYQTKYKQALLNHENCKHTKQREFCCALCTYRTFSNTSLFFHKRKVHGYVPGDKGWQENYASRELEVSSTEVLLSYNLAMTLHSESSLSLPGKEPCPDKDKPPDLEGQEEPCHQKALCSEEGSIETEREESAGEQECKNTEAAASKGLSGRASSESSEELDRSAQGCVLHLEPLCNSEPSLEQLAIGMPAASSDNEKALNIQEIESTYQVLGSKDSLLLEESEPGLDDIPEFEEEAEIHDGSDLERSNSFDPGSREREEAALQNLKSCGGDSHNAELLQTPLSSEQNLGYKESALWTGALKQDSLQLDSSPETSSLAAEDGLSPEEVSPSESVLKALRRQDKEQAETLVLEGRVQMLVVQSKSQVFKCEKCSYITRKEKSMLVHCKADCQSKKCPLVCQECGATFKQQRGLNTHLHKKCPILMKKNSGKTACFEQPPCRRTLERTATRKNSEGILGDAEVNNLPQASWKVERRPVNAESMPNVLPDEQSLALSPQDKRSHHGSESGMEETRTDAAGCVSERYFLEQGKFHCKSCSFLCSRESTIRSHVEESCRGLEQSWCLLCSKPFRSKRALKIHLSEGHTETPQPSLLERPNGTTSPGVADEQRNEHTSCEKAPQPSELAGVIPPPLVTTPKRRPFSCPTCPFTCHQERALKTHKKRGCLKLGEFRCTLCPFTSKAAAALRLHRKLHRKYLKARPQLSCRQCDFTCKQARCLRQHVRIKHEGLKPHQCPYCDFSTTRRYRLDAHQSLHTGVGRIACAACGQTFGTNSKLRIHHLRVHEKKPTHFCPFCDYSGYIQNDITRHVGSCHQGELNFACSRCEARFSSETALKQHTLRQHEEKVSYACPRCAFVCHSEATLKCHIQKQHPHLECATCKETLTTREELEEHKKLHFNHRCDVCSFAAKERQQLVSHYLEAHEPSAGADPPFKCMFCDFGCRHQLVYDHHVKSHGGTRIYKCADCEYSTRNKQKITWHIRIHTGEKPYKCHQCQYACADPSRLKYHMRIHKEERKYLCPECGYKCKWVNQLKYHMTKHTGIKPYQCDECKYCTNRADALRIHKETRHREARSFICEQCGKAFKTRFLLKTHLKKHSEEKPYICNVCYRGFRWAAGLRHHYLIHTNEHPFFCRFCSYKAKQKFQVIKHLQKHHPGQEELEGDLSKGVGKDPSILSVHLHDVQLEISSSSSSSKPLEESAAQMSPHG